MPNMYLENERENINAVLPEQDSQPVPNYEIYLDGVEMYENIILGLRDKLKGLIEKDVMSEKVAESIMNDYMYQSFNQVIRVNYN